MVAGGDTPPSDALLLREPGHSGAVCALHQVDRPVPGDLAHPPRHLRESARNIQPFMRELGGAPMCFRTVTRPDKLTRVPRSATVSPGSWPGVLPAADPLAVLWGQQGNGVRCSPSGWKPSPPSSGAGLT